MAYTVSTRKVRTPGQLENVDSSGNVESRGALVCGELDITSYAAPEVVTASSLGLNKIYGVYAWLSENAEHELHAAVVASNEKSVSLTFDDVGSGTEAGSDDIGNVGFIAFGEALNSGSN